MVPTNVVVIIEKSIKFKIQRGGYSLPAVTQRSYKTVQKYDGVRS